MCRGRIDEGPGQAERVWACSEFVAESCTRRPEMLAELRDTGDLKRSYVPGEGDAAQAASASPSTSHACGKRWASSPARMF